MRMASRFSCSATRAFPGRSYRRWVLSSRAEAVPHPNERKRRRPWCGFGKVRFYHRFSQETLRSTKGALFRSKQEAKATDDLSGARKEGSYTVQAARRRGRLPRRPGPPTWVRVPPSYPAPISSARLFQIFTSNPVLPQYPHLQAALFTFADPLTSHSLACTCTRFRQVEESQRCARTSSNNIKLNVRHPEKAWVRVAGACKVEEGEGFTLRSLWREADEEELRTVVQPGRVLSWYAFECVFVGSTERGVELTGSRREWERPAYISKKLWKEQGYAGIQIECGAILYETQTVSDSLFKGEAILEVRTSLPAPASRIDQAASRNGYFVTTRLGSVLPSKTSGLCTLVVTRWSPRIRFDRHLWGWLPLNPVHARLEEDFYSMRCAWAA